MRKIKRIIVNLSSFFLVYILRRTINRIGFPDLDQEPVIIRSVIEMWNDTPMSSGRACPTRTKPMKYQTKVPIQTPIQKTL